MDWLTAQTTYVLAIGILVVLASIYASRRYQLCPHCRRLVPRAVRGWLRCRTCGRQYHRSVQLRR
jgi:tRNA(Ile2) C34 agmatinyltransferase TiaS